MTRTLIAAALMGLLLGGCTSGGGSDQGEPAPPTSETTTAPPVSDTSTSCGQVWVVGKVLPKDFDGCTTAGTVDRGVVNECKDGTTLFAFGGTEKLFAIAGTAIRKGGVDEKTGDADATFLGVLESCVGA